MMHAAIEEASDHKFWKNYLPHVELMTFSRDPLVVELLESLSSLFLEKDHKINNEE